MKVVAEYDMNLMKDEVREIRFIIQRMRDKSIKREKRKSGTL